MTGMALLLCSGYAVLLCLSVQAYENLALHQPAWQSSTALSDTGAERAVDGKYTDMSPSGGQCALSTGLQTVEWGVDLGAVLNIHHISIQYATYNRVWDKKNVYSGDFLGFSVHISNTINKEDGVLCFRDTNYTRATIPNPVNIICPYPGRYVIYFNNRTHPMYPEGYSEYAWINLCEVEVYGCPSTGYYGEKCSLECPKNCQDGNCDVVGGTCFACKPGYRGPRCTQDCPEGLYGRNCLQNCSMTCGDPGRCDTMTGHCNGGCQVGWTGAMCDKECPEGLYGRNCVQKCSMTCGNPEKCDIMTGHCNGGCQVGWTGAMCDKDCPEGLYGRNCLQNCSMTCGNPGKCDTMTGHCNGGCQVGWTGSMCEKGWI